MAQLDTGTGPALKLPPKGAGAVGYPSYIRSAKYVIAGGSAVTASDYDAVIWASDGAAATIEAFDLPSGALIWDVGWRVKTAFNAEVKLSIGDSNDVDGYAQIASVAATAADGATLIWTTRNQLGYFDLGGDSNRITDTTALAAYSFLLPMLHYNSSKPGEYMSIDVTLSDTAASAGVLEVYVWYDMTVLQP